MANDKITETFYWRRGASLALAGACLAGLAASAGAVEDAVSGQAAAGEAGALAAAAGLPAAKKAWLVTPGFSLSETYTDHVSSDPGNGGSDLITRISPGISLRGQGKRLTLSADYHLNAVFYASNSDENELQQALNAFATLEAVEDWLFIDMNGVISQQYINPLGALSADNSSINDNLTQTGSFQLSPYIKGRLGRYADYTLRYSRSYTQSESDLASDTDVESWTGRLSGATSLAKLGWAVNGSRQRYDYNNGRKTESSDLRGLLTFALDPQFNLLASLGRESNDFASLDSKTYDTHGYGFNWRPTERTDVYAFREKRFFGYGHNLSFKHRMKRTAIQFTDSRDTSALPARFTTVGLGNIYDLLYNLFSSSIPDAAERAQATESLLATLGIPPDTRVTTDFLTSQVTLQRRQELSLLVTGVRNTVTLSLSRSRSEGLSALTGLGDVFNTYTDITQRGLSVNWSHRLTPLSTAGVTASYSKGSGSRTGGEDSSASKQLAVTYTTKLGARTNASLSVRQTQFTGSLSRDYTEHAVVGILSMTF